MEKHLEIYKRIEELYHADTTDEAIEKYALQNQEKMALWKKAFDEYDLSDVLQAIDEYFAKKNNRTPPRIPQIEAMLRVSGAQKETPCEHETVLYQCDYNIRYMNEDVESGNCHHNRYYYDEALQRIRANEYPFIADIENPTHTEMTEVLEDICLKRTGNKWEFLSKNDLISQGYDVDKTYSVDDILKTMFKRIN